MVAGANDQDCDRSRPSEAGAGGVVEFCPHPKWKLSSTMQDHLGRAGACAQEKSFAAGAPSRLLYSRSLRRRRDSELVFFLVADIHNVWSFPLGVEL